VRGWALGLAVGAVEIDRGQRVWALPAPVVPGVYPQAASSSVSTSGIKHRDRRVVGKQLLRGKDVLGEPLLRSYFLLKFGVRLADNIRYGITREHVSWELSSQLVEQTCSGAVFIERHVVNLPHI
jgi:hypothetical protein